MADTVPASGVDTNISIPKAKPVDYRRITIQYGDDASNVMLATWAEQVLYWLYANDRNAFDDALSAVVVANSRILVNGILV